MGLLQNVKREAPDLSGIRPLGLGVGKADGGLGLGEADGDQEEADTVEC